MLGSGVASSPASKEVMPTGIGIFPERGIWLFPREQGRRAGLCWLAKDACRRCSFCACCCLGGLGGCDGSLEPPLPQENPKVIMYLHGGAFALTNAETYPWLLGYELVRRTGAVVLIPDFQRTPQVRFEEPGDPISQCLQLYRNLLLLYGPSRIVLMGDSAGGNLAMAVLFAAQSEGLTSCAGLVLISPWADTSEEAACDPTRSSNSENDFLPEARIRSFADAYATAALREKPLASPLLAPQDWFVKLPPVFLTFGSHEILCGQQQKLAARLREAKVLRGMYEAPQMPHVFPLFAAVVWGAGTPTTEASRPPAVEALLHMQSFLVSLGFASANEEVPFVLGDESIS